MKKIKTMDVREFGLLCEEMVPKRIVLRTENQKWNKVSNLCKFDLVFDTISVSALCRTIHLSAGACARVLFDNISLLEVDSSSSLLGTVVRVVCGKQYDDKVSYTLLLS